MLKLTSKEWIKHNPLLIGAAISFYIILSMGPILAVIILILGEIFGKQSAEGQIVREVSTMVGEKPSEILQTIIQKASTSSYKTMAVISSIPLIFFGTTMVFFQLRNALNIIWGIKEEKTTLSNKVKQYSFSFLMFLIVGFFFFLLILKNPALVLIKDYLNNIITIPIFLFDILNLVITYLLITILFAAVYKILPKADIDPRDIWIGAAVTSVFFTIVQFLIGINAENSSIDSSLGAIGSFTILFLWIFYSSLVFLFGASFTKVYSEGIIRSKKK
ncbi:MAG: YihY/virulence factor BrkB family protein [Ignavibacteriaceae bacterium]